MVKQISANIALQDRKHKRISESQISNCILLLDAKVIISVTETTNKLFKCYDTFFFLLLTLKFYALRIEFFQLTDTKTLLCHLWPRCPAMWQMALHLK